MTINMLNKSYQINIMEISNMPETKTLKPSKKKKPVPPGLKMKELVRATGVPKSTILHYLKEGLLPTPIKTSRNMAYYDPACVERITFIKLMQSKHRLPLAVIKNLINKQEQSREVEPLVELSAAIFGRSDQELLDKKAFCQATGFTRREVDDLVNAGLLMPLEKDRFDTEDLAIGHTLFRGKELGITIEESAFYLPLARQIVDHEMALQARRTQDLSMEDMAAFTLEITRSARALRAYIVDRVFQHRIMSGKGAGGPGEKNKSAHGPGRLVRQRAL